MSAIPRTVPKSVLTVTPSGILISTGRPGAPCNACPLQPNTQVQHTLVQKVVKLPPTDTLKIATKCQEDSRRHAVVFEVTVNTQYDWSKSWSNPD